MKRASDGRYKTVNMINGLSFEAKKKHKWFMNSIMRACIGYGFVESKLNVL